MRCLVLGTDTGVGKTRVTQLLCRGLRAVGRRVWLHKPLACPVVDGVAEDAQALLPCCGDGQAPASLVPIHLQAAAAPLVAARAEGRALPLGELQRNLQAVLAGAPGDVLVEGVGGVLVPLADDDSDILDLAPSLPLVLVCRPHLGTLNHSLLSLAAARSRGRQVLGWIVNAHEPVDWTDLAVAGALTELPRLSGLPILARLPYSPEVDETTACRLAAAVLQAYGAAA